jgi:hypothetical protein
MVWKGGVLDKTRGTGLANSIEIPWVRVLFLSLRSFAFAYDVGILAGWATAKPGQVRVNAPTISLMWMANATSYHS